jgi:hypothetical protein
MPIRPENRTRYPKDWKAISARIRYERADSRCECVGECGLDHGGRCMARHLEPHPTTGSKVVLTTAHLADPIEDCSDENLRAMCQQCHNRYDMPSRRAGIRERAFVNQGKLFPLGDANPKESP